MWFVDSSTGRARPATGAHSNAVTSVTYAPDGRRVVSTDNDRAIVWNPQTTTSMQVLTEQAHGVAFGPNSKTLYTSSLGGVLLKWDLGGGRSFGRRFSLGAGSPCCGAVSPLAPPLALSPNGTRFAVRLGTSTVGVFSARTLRQQASFTIRRKGAVITALAWSPAGPDLAVGGHSGLVQLWRVDGAPQLLHSLTGFSPISGLPEAVQGLAFSPDGRLLAATNSSQTPESPGLALVRFGNRLLSLAIWRASTGTLLGAPHSLGIGAARYVGALAFSADGKQLAVSVPSVRGVPIAADLILDPKTFKVRHTLHPRGADATVSLAFAPNGALATGTEGGVLQLWNPISGEQIAGPIAVSSGPVTSIGFDSTGQRIATTGQDGTAKAWFTSTLQQEGTVFNTEQGTASSVAFSSSSKRLLVINDKGTAFTWPMSLAAWEQRACAIAGRNLTTAEWDRFLPGRDYARVCP
jgi:WD40 repeat protein